MVKKIILLLAKEYRMAKGKLYKAFTFISIDRHKYILVFNFYFCFLKNLLVVNKQKHIYFDLKNFLS